MGNQESITQPKIKIYQKSYEDLVKGIGRTSNEPLSSCDAVYFEYKNGAAFYCDRCNKLVTMGWEVLQSIPEDNPNYCCNCVEIH